MARFVNGWIKLHREIFDIFKKEPFVGLTYIYLTAMANWRDGESKVYLDGKVVALKKGQLVIGILEISEALGIAKNTVKRALTLLEDGGFIRILAAREGRVITVEDYEYNQTDVPQGATSLTLGCSPADPSADPSADTWLISDRPPIEEGRSKNKNKKKVYTSALQADAPDVAEFLITWNNSRGPLAAAEKMTAKRRLKIKARISENPDLTYWASVIKRLAASEFCSSGTWCNIDWLIANDTNHVKAAEGKYDNRVKEHIYDYNLRD